MKLHLWKHKPEVLWWSNSSCHQLIFKIEFLLKHAVSAQFVSVAFVVIPLLGFYCLSITWKWKKNLILSCTWQLQNSHRRRAFKIWSWQEIIINSRDAFDDHSSDALRDFGPNTYKRRLNGWRKKRVSQSVCMVFKLLFDT